MQSIKCVVVGDGAVGKTCVLNMYAKNSIPEDYAPTVFNNYMANIMIDNTAYNLNLWDTAGQVHDPMRVLAYPQTDVFLVCFSVVSPTSLDNCRDKWVPEIRQHCPKTPILLIGTKTDLRDNQEIIDELRQKDSSPVTKEDATMMARNVGAELYMECSAITRGGLSELFEQAVKILMRTKKAKKGKDKCIIC
eukprot:TRINITY_DN7103_c0_g1_i1.p1 TRINITY_DN7103_c0_g1~~TRINITY_DN7103_c0_g1_i1.p1  ORF type:complete len:225 (-),score=38.52 TRINITY_DN7103_c0_g1_i1:64-639(-)